MAKKKTTKKSEKAKIEDKSEKANVSNKAMTNKRVKQDFSKLPEKVTVVGTGKSKHLPKGVEKVTSKDTAKILVDKGAVTIK